MSGRIEKNDVIAQEALDTFAQAQKELNELLKTMKEIATAGVEIRKSFAAADSFKKSGDAAKNAEKNIQSYAGMQAELNKIINQLVSAQNKLAVSRVDENKQLIKTRIEQKKVLDQIKEEITGAKAKAASQKEAISRQKAAESLDRQRSKAFVQRKNQEKSATESLDRQRSKALQKQAEEQHRAKQLVGTYKGLQIELQKNIDKYRNLAIAGKKNSAEGRRLTGVIREQKRALDQANGSTGTLRGAFSKLTRAAGNLIAAYIGLQAVRRLTQSIFQNTKALDAQKFAFEKVIKDTKELQQTQEFLIDISKRYGADLLTLSERYLKFRAATEATNLSAKETQQIFESFAKTAGVLGLRTDEMSGVFLALEQMLSKGKVTTEELRRQLGERIPGAFNIMAKALGVTVSKLDKMLKAGEVLSEDALPKLAREVEKTFGIENVNNIDTLIAAQNRLTTAWLGFVKELEASETFIKFFKFASDVVEGFTSIISGLGEQYIRTQSQANIFADNVIAASERVGDQAQFKAIEQGLSKSEAAMVAQKAVIDDLTKSIEEQQKIATDRAEQLRKVDVDAYNRVADAVNNYRGNLAAQFKMLGEHSSKHAAFVNDLVAQSEFIEQLKDKLAELTKARKDDAEEVEDVDIDKIKLRNKAEIEAIKERQQFERLAAARSIEDSAMTEEQKAAAIESVAHQHAMEIINLQISQTQQLLDTASIEEKEKEKLILQLAQFRARKEKEITDFEIEELERGKDVFDGIAKDKERIAQEESDKIIEATTSQVDAEILELERRATEAVSQAKNKKEILDIEAKLARDILQIQIDALRGIVDLEQITAEDRAKIKEWLFNVEVNLEKKKRDASKKTMEEQLQFEKERAKLRAELVNEGFNFFIGLQEARMSRAEATFEHETNLAGTNTKEKIRAENKYDREKIKIQRRQAIAEKAQAAFNIIINTAAGVANAASKVLTIPLIPLIVGIGALQLATVLAQPLPSFAAGGEHEGGMARFSEEGSELFISKAGSAYLTPEKETVGHMPAGTFISHRETQQALAQSALNNFVHETTDLSMTNKYLRDIRDKEQVVASDGKKVIRRGNLKMTVRC